MIAGCVNESKGNETRVKDTASMQPPAQDTATFHPVPLPAIEERGDTIISPVVIATMSRPDSIVNFAKTLLGVPYLYASTDPAKGFDCSGFITYVFHHFNITVPRSSVNFTNYGKTIPEKKARPGDLILFTGTDSTIRVVGHMGIVESIANDTLRFIHSSSGKANGVVISALGNYYRGRFVKVIRLFPDEMFH
jgi:cell wall-associated NlpC family hydrolase